MSIIHKYFKLDRLYRSLLSEALLFLFFEKIRVHTLPFKKVIKPQIKEHYTTEADIRFLKKVRVAVDMANKAAFWSNVCLVQSLAARRMLDRRGIASSFYLGLHFKDPKQLGAHAWLVSGGIQITPKGSAKLKEIAVF